MEQSIDLRSLQGRLRPYDSDMIAFAQKLIQTPSLPGDEKQVADLVLLEMKRLGYDDAWIDAAGNAVGLVRGASSRQSVLFNAHMDHVSVGEETAWAHPPYSGALVDDEVWGRGAVDLKGSLAAMVYGVGALKREGLVPPCDVYVAGVVFEEEGGYGTDVLLQSIHPAYCVIGEATCNQFSLGHRGVIGSYVEITGRASHASMVDIGINPHFSAARFLLGLSDVKHLRDEMLGPSTAAPTLYGTDQTSGNVIPGRVRIYVDWRSVPGETRASITAELDKLLQASLEPGTSGTVRPRSYHNKTYTGQTVEMQVGKIAVKLDPQSSLAVRSHRVLESALGRTVEKIVWRFCTDGSGCAEVGIPIFGFGPGDPELAHTSYERVSLAQLKEAVVGNAALAMCPVLEA